MEDLVESLNASWVEAGKLLRNSEKLKEQAEGVPAEDRSRKFDAVMLEMGDLLFALENAHSDLGTLLKFRKNRAGEPLTQAVAQA